MSAVRGGNAARLRIFDSSETVYRTGMHIDPDGDIVSTRVRLFDLDSLSRSRYRDLESRIYYAAYSRPAMW